MFGNFKWTEVARQRLALLNYYEPLQPYILRRLSQIAEIDVFVDIGANIGAYSIMMAETAKEIHAFEPNPPTLLELKRNIELNALGSIITIHDVALSDVETTASFGVVGTYSGANGLSDTSIHDRSKFVSEISVRCMPLDAVLTPLEGRRVCFKIDVEGHESAVLRGAQKILRDNSVVIQIENYNRDDESISTLLNSCGYKQLLRIGPDHYYSNMQNIVNDRLMLSVMEDVSDQFIADQFAPKHSSSPVHLRLIGGLTLEVTGKPAALARRLRKKLSRR